MMEITPFESPWWLRGPHAQTIGGKLFRPDLRLPIERERWETPDRDFVDLDFHDRSRGERPLVLVLHGLEGSALRSYMRLTYRALDREGLDAVGLNFRSCSGEPNRAARFYHSGETEDLGLVIDGLLERFPGRTLGVMGYSLGGNVLLKYLGERGAGAAPAAAVAVSVPFDLAAGADALERDAMGRFYGWVFLRMLRKKAAAKRDLLEPLLDIDGVVRARTIREFDELATARLHDFDGAADYYERSSSARFIERIRTPTLLLQSLDDPFLPASAIPTGAIGANPHVQAILTRTGGHVGFVGGTPWAPTHWAETQAARWLAGRLQ